RDALGVYVGLVERQVIAQFGLDLVVRRQRFAVGRAEAPRGLALGEREIIDALLGHDAGRSRRDAHSHAGSMRGSMRGAILASHARIIALCISISSASAAPSWAASRRSRSRPAIA